MSILVTRPLEQSLQLAQYLKDLGYDPVMEPLLTVEHLEVPPIVWSVFDGLLLTSIQALGSLVTIDPQIPCFCVGEATAEAAKRKGFREVYACGGDAQTMIAFLKQCHQTRTGKSEEAITENDGDSGNSLSNDEIMTLSVNDSSNNPHDSMYKKSFLYLSGEEVAADLRKALSPLYHVQRIVVYRTHLQKRFSAVVRELLEVGTLDKVLLFSKRTAQAFEQCVKNDRMNTSRIKVYCLSDEVAKVCRSLEFQRILVAQKPTQEALIELLHGELDD